MVEKILISACAGALFLMWMRMRRQKRDIYEFTEHLERCLDQMILGEEPEAETEYRDSLWERTYEKLYQVTHVWRLRNQKSSEEKQQIKELISDISHQTRTPVANLKLYLELLEQEGETWEERQDFIKKLQEQTGKLDFLLQSMVKMSRLETGIIEIRQQETRLQTTLGAAVASIVPKAEAKQITLHAQCQEELVVNHDSRWTAEALFNILDNAVKYTGSGGEIWITAKRQEFFTRISIRDNGKGIAQERQAQIFRRFYREPEVHEEEGIGVGLYLARKIMTLQGGYIQVVSEEGKGAEFQVYLPNGIEKVFR